MLRKRGVQTSRFFYYQSRINLKNIKLTVAYDGSAYHGWQRQKNALTVQQILEEKISLMVRSSVTIIGSGRTDAGVHAAGQVCNFFHNSKIKAEDMIKGLNAILPDSIFIKDAVEVPESFHSRYSATAKTYNYVILNRREPDIFKRNYLWHIKKILDIDSMKYCLARLEGSFDFSSFMASGSKSQNNTIRTIFMAKLNVYDHGIINIILKANGFLRHMVRNIVGTIVEVGLGKRSTAEFVDILAAKDRKAAGKTAPAQGLFLMEVEYN